MQQNDSQSAAKILTLIAVSVIVLATYFILITPAPDKKKIPSKQEAQGKSQGKSQVQSQGQSQGKPEEEVNIGGDFTLTNLDNQKENTVIYNKKYKLIYFGFTYCPDICPTSLSLMSEVIDEVKSYGIEIVPIFVTIDPNRDTAEVLKPYLAHFNPKIIGYTGSQEEVKKVADMYRVYYNKVPRVDAAEDEYLMDHSSFFYLMSPDMKFIKHFPSSSSAEYMSNFIKSKVREKD